MFNYLKGLLQRKDLIFYLVTSGLKAEHRNSFLGYVWWLLDPLLSTFIYYFVVVVIFHRGSEGYGASIAIGLIVWRWLNSTVSSASKSIISKSGIISQVYLPKMVFPLSITFTQLLNFGFGLVVIVFFLFFNGIFPGFQVLWLPFLVVIQLLLLTSISLVVAFICVFIRDVDNFISHLLRIWFYFSPVIWELGMIPAKYHWITFLNPMTPILTSYRNIFMYNKSPEVLSLVGIGVVSFLIIVLMTYFYSQKEHNIIKVL